MYSMDKFRGEWFDREGQRYSVRVVEYSLLNATPGYDRMGLKLVATSMGGSAKPIVVDLFASHGTYHYLKLGWDSPDGQKHRDELLDCFVRGCQRAVFLQKVSGTTEFRLSDSSDNPLGLYHTPVPNLASPPPQFLLAEDPAYELELAKYIRVAVLRWLEPVSISGRAHNDICRDVGLDAELLDLQVQWLLKKEYAETRTSRAGVKLLVITDEGLEWLASVDGRDSGGGVPAVSSMPHSTDKYDCFICHASEDKKPFVAPLAERLRNEGCRVWYDDFVLKVGDSLPKKIDEGLAQSRHGVVVVSPSFFGIKKHWTRKELDALAVLARERGILPVWLDVTEADITPHLPTLAAIVAARADEGLDTVVSKLMDAMGMPPPPAVRKE